MVALLPGETHRNISLRVEGTASHGGAGERLQKAKVGYCVCCSYITHVAVPPNYTAGPYVEEICMGTSLRQTQGPWAGRYLAAHQYWNWRGNLPTHWDWAPRPLDITAPLPLLFSLVRGKTSVAVPGTNAPCEKTSVAVTGTNAPCRPPPPVLDQPPRRPRDELHAAPVAPKPSPPDSNLAHGMDGTLRQFLNTTLFAAGTVLRQTARPEEKVGILLVPVKALCVGNLNQPSPPTRIVKANQTNCARNLTLRCLVKVNRNLEKRNKMIARET